MPKKDFNNFIDQDFELYKLAIDDEHYYRDAFNNRLSYHTNILVALITAIGAAYFQAKEMQHYLIISIFSIIFSWMNYQSMKSLERIYNHFIEMLHVREEFEVRLGLRKDDTLENILLKSTISYKPKFWKFGHLYTKKLVASRHNGGYYARMKKIFLLFSFIGIVSFFSSAFIFISYILDLCFFIFCPF
jgi:hypothetical protein